MPWVRGAGKIRLHAGARKQKALSLDLADSIGGIHFCSLLLLLLLLPPAILVDLLLSGFNIFTLPSTRHQP